MEDFLIIKWWKVKARSMDDAGAKIRQIPANSVTTIKVKGLKEHPELIEFQQRDIACHFREIINDEIKL